MSDVTVASLSSKQKLHHDMHTCIWGHGVYINTLHDSRSAVQAVQRDTAGRTAIGHDNATATTGGENTGRERKAT